MKPVVLVFSVLQKFVKTGSLCCVAARPHGPDAASGEWSIGPQEPYWRTNTSYSPPPSRWDFRFQPESLSFGSNEESQLYGSSTSSNSRESRSWLRGNHHANHHYHVSDGAGPYFSSPSEISPAQQWTPPIIQEINVDDYGNSSRRAQAQLSFSPVIEGILAVQDSIGSTSSRSDNSDYESVVKSHSSHRSRRYFMSKPIHPLSLPYETPAREIHDTRANGFPESDPTFSQRERHQFGNASGDIDFTDVSVPTESNTSNQLHSLSEGYNCGLCERYLSQRSPWGSRSIVRSGDMPVAGVLSCRHIFHAECLEQTTPKARRSDPPCPLCARENEENTAEQRSCSRLRNSNPRLRPFREDGPSKPWGCAQAGDCVESALQAPPRNTMLLLNRNRIKKNLSLKGNSGKEFPGKPRKSGTFSSQLFIGSVDQEAVDSETTGSSRTK